MSINTIDLISDAFFASRVIDTINEKKLNPENRAIFEEVRKRIFEIKKGKELVSFKKTDDNSLSSLTAYRRAIEIIPILDIPAGVLDDEPEQCIDKFIASIEEEVNKVLNKNKIENGDLVKTKSFFKAIRKQAIEESNNTFMVRKEMLPWMEAMRY